MKKKKKKKKKEKKRWKALKEDLMLDYMCSRDTQVTFQHSMTTKGFNVQDSFQSRTLMMSGGRSNSILMCLFQL
jgi:hypothetical protein